MVAAVVTVTVDRTDGSAHVVLRVDCDGHEALVEPMRRQDAKLQIVGASLRRVVTQALSYEPDGPVVDMIRAGRA